MNNQDKAQNSFYNIVCSLTVTRANQSKNKIQPKAERKPSSKENFLLQRFHKLVRAANALREKMTSSTPYVANFFFFFFFFFSKQRATTLHFARAIHQHLVKINYKFISRGGGPSPPFSTNQPGYHGGSFCTSLPYTMLYPRCGAASSQLTHCPFPLSTVCARARVCVCV